MTEFNYVTTKYVDLNCSPVIDLDFMKRFPTLNKIQNFLVDSVCIVLIELIKVTVKRKLAHCFQKHSIEIGSQHADGKRYFPPTVTMVW